MFLVEQAHWYYEDFVREEKPHLRGMKLREFAELMFNKCASLGGTAARWMRSTKVHRVQIQRPDGGFDRPEPQAG